MHSEKKRIRLWFSNLRTEDKILLFAMVIMMSLYLFFLFFLPSIFPSFLAEFTAGFLGIVIGFTLDRYLELRKKIRITKQIIDNLLVELYDNLDLVKKIKPEIKPDRTIFHFELCKTSAWDMFGSRLELDNIEVLFELGSAYHRMQLFNEGMRLEHISNALSRLIQRNPNFLDKLEKDLETIIEALENLKI